MARIAVAGATGRVGRHVVDVLQAGGHDVMAISRSHGVDVITGDGLSALDHAPTRCRALGGIVAHLDRHFGARAAAERFHLACPLSGDALRPGLRYLQVTDRRTSMTLAPPASPIRKESAHETDAEDQAPSPIGPRTARAADGRRARPGHRSRPPDRPSQQPWGCVPSAVRRTDPGCAGPRPVVPRGQLPGPADQAGEGTG
jgi:hypothetical protein